MENDFLKELFYDDTITMDFYETKEIVGCTICKGAGFTPSEEMADYHKGEYRTVYKNCYKCQGDGKLTKKITTSYVRTRGSFGKGEFVKETLVPYSSDPISEPFLYSRGVSKKFKLEVNGDL